jgi:CHAD domain-containing protein
MADGKWVSGLHIDTPVADAARRVLAARLGVIARQLPLAVESADDDVEHVHQLRVATRRTGAAMRIFADCLPDKLRQSVKKQLRKLRQAAGEARDWDVFLQALADWSNERPADEQPGIDFLRGLAFARRVDAQGHLGEVADMAPDVDGVVADVHRPLSGPDTLGGLALMTLNDLFADFEQAVAGDLTDFDQLHQVRIQGKRLRYAMEVFADCFGPAFRGELYAAVEEMQEILGAANDSHDAVGRLTGLRDRVSASLPADWPHLRPGIEALLHHHEEHLPEQRGEFEDWLRRWRELRIPLSGLLVASAPLPTSETA